jgi:uncharacterized HAD superfamily protein
MATKKKNNTFNIISPPTNCKKIRKTVKKQTEKIRIGIDLDGVLALQPMNGFWFHLRLLKEKLLKKLSVRAYYLPKSSLEKLAWKVINQRRKPFANKNRSLNEVYKLPNVELYLITSRYSFMKQITADWLNRHNFLKYFKEIIYNHGDKNPHSFKVDIVNKLNLQYFIDDDWETISALQAQTTTNIIWILEQHKKIKNIPIQITAKKNLHHALSWILNQLR